MENSKLREAKKNLEEELKFWSGFELVLWAGFWFLCLGSILYFCKDLILARIRP